MQNLSQIERIKIKLSLAKNTDSYFEQFGSSSHRYLLNPPIAIEKIEAFEKKLDITIPKELKLFYTKIGYGGVGYAKESHHNLGAGPNYGIMTLDNPLLFFIETDSGALQKEPYFNKEITHDMWYKRFYEDVEDESDEAYEKELELAYSGMMNISSCGCQGYSSIILNGNDTGCVIRTYSDPEFSPSFIMKIIF